MGIWKPKMDLEQLNALNKNTMAEHLGIVMTDFTDDTLTAKMPVDNRTLQPFGIMHGGASCALAESVGSLAANCCIDREKQVCVGLDITTSHIRQAKSGFVLGTARPIHLGKTTHVWEIQIKNEQDQLISLTRLTIIVLDTK
jgi:1,4-dihydroxy-2-naphthoyl-CoA hydrolase